MFRQFVSTALLMLVFLGSTAAQYAVEVVEYEQGSTAATIFGSDPVEFFNQAAGALGSPERFTGEGVFPGAVTPFNPPFLPSEVLSIGEGGHVTLRLSNFVIPQNGAREIGVFTNSGLVDDVFPNGIVGDPAAVFSNDSADVDVSADGVNWVSLGHHVFDLPTSGYSDIAQTAAADFQVPLIRSVSDFSGLTHAEVLDEYGGSGGGTWLDISAAGLSEVGFVRFSVEDDADATSQLNFELDAVSISRDAVGATTVPEPSSCRLLWIATLFVLAVRRSSRA